MKKYIMLLYIVLTACGSNNSGGGSGSSVLASVEAYPVGVWVWQSGNLKLLDARPVGVSNHSLNQTIDFSSIAENTNYSNKILRYSYRNSLGEWTGYDHITGTLSSYEFGGVFAWFSIDQRTISCSDTSVSCLTAPNGSTISPNSTQHYSYYSGIVDGHEALVICHNTACGTYFKQ